MTTTLQAAADAFYAAGNKLLAGDSSAFEAIWSEADDISLLGPMGASYTGRTAVMEEFARESAMGFEGILVADHHQFVESAEMGYLVCMEANLRHDQGRRSDQERHSRHHDLPQRIGPVAGGASPHRSLLTSQPLVLSPPQRGRSSLLASSSAARSGQAIQ